MADNQSATVEALVIKDDSGNWYVIPRDTLEQHKLTPEQQRELESALSADDVAGFGGWEGTRSGGGGGIGAHLERQTTGRAVERHAAESRPAEAMQQLLGGGGLMLGRMTFVDPGLASHAGQSPTLGASFE